MAINIVIFVLTMIGLTILGLLLFILLPAREAGSFLWIKRDFGGFFRLLV